MKEIRFKEFLHVADCDMKLIVRINGYDSNAIKGKVSNFYTNHLELENLIVNDIDIFDNVLCVDLVEED